MGGYYFKIVFSMVDLDDSGSIIWYKLKNGIYMKEVFGLFLVVKVVKKLVLFYLSGCFGLYFLVDWINVYD